MRTDNLKMWEFPWEGSLSFSQKFCVRCITVETNTKGSLHSSFVSSLFPLKFFLLSFIAFNGSQLNRLDLSLPPGFEVAWTPDGRKYYIE